VSKIDPSDYELWESLILSEQLPHCELTEILRANPNFKQWLLTRADQRQEGTPILTWPREQKLK